MAFDAAAVAAWMKLPTFDDVAMGDVVDAVTAYIDRCPQAPRLAPEPPAEVGAWAPDTELAALMLAGRLYRRRNSPDGIAAMSDAGVSFVAKYDPEISRLLNLDAWSKPVVG